MIPWCVASMDRRATLERGATKRRLLTRIGFLFGLVAVFAWAPSARADETPATRSALHAATNDEPHTLAQLGVGLLSLPSASVCLTGITCTKGDTAIEVNFWQMYRANRYFAVGAGASFALKPTTDKPASEMGGTRNHSRSYFLVEAQARYYAIHTLPFEAWVGGTIGGVVLSDRYSIDAGGPPLTIAIIGPRASTLRTEGLSIGGLLGIQWTIAPNWGFGGSIRYLRWFLPHTPATTVFLDRATLTDQQSAVDIGISCTYRIAL
jgi:hypothetical protein